MKHTITATLALMMALTLASCSSDNEGSADNGGMKTITLDIPIDIYSASGTLTGSKATAQQGDPGVSTEFKAPLWLYIVAFVSENGGADCEVLTKTFQWTDAEVEDNWTKQNEGQRDERWRKNVRVTFNISRTFNNVAGLSRVFAIASRTDLSALLHNDVTSYTAMTQVEDMTLDLTGYTSAQLGDIYSTPAYDRSDPVESTDNGVVESNGTTLTCSTVKLYHAAAKADFTWEVEAGLRTGTELKSITCTGLPTTCKIFKPTENPAGTATSTILGAAADNAAYTVSEGNKWTGRAYAYVLQPPTPGTLSYTVAYGGTAGRANTTATMTPATASFSKVFTGWYRVAATVK